MLAHLDFWDYLTFASLIHCRRGSRGAALLVLGLPGKIAIARKHPDAAQKQGTLPTAVDVALQNRWSIRQVITTAPFNPAQAQEVAQQISSIAAQRRVNRLELRNQIFQVLTPQQQQQYMQIVQQSLEGLE